MKRKYTEKWGNMGGLKKAPFFLPSFSVEPAVPVKREKWRHYNTIILLCFLKTKSSDKDFVRL